MKRLVPSLACAALMLGGCASTESTRSKLPEVNGEFVFPSMQVIKAEPYVWDNSASEALNVVRMAQPTGVGNSLKDYPNGESASIGRVGALSGVFDAGINFLDSGIFSIVLGENLRNSVNENVDFKPTIVEVVSKDVVSQNNGVNYKLARDRVATKIQSAVAKAFPDVEWAGVFSASNGKEYYDLTLLLKSEELCKANAVLSTGDEDASPFVTRNLSELYVDSKRGNETFCAMMFEMNAPYITEDGNAVITAELVLGGYFVDAITRFYDGYVIIPDYYDLNRGRGIRTDYAFVAKNGEKLLFQKPE